MSTTNSDTDGQRKYVINPVHKGKFTRETYMDEFFHQNKAYRHALESTKENPEQLLKKMRERYQWYRKGWRGIAANAVENKLGSNYVATTKNPALCIDLELAAMCDLACPFCFRQWIATPDKMMDTKLAYSIIDQAADLGVPSMKFNWRGEPLLHGELTKLIAHAKKRGIIETLINSNATHLNEKKAEELIDAGLDILIYSFDGGSKETYNKNRPGRFKENSFDEVYKNIRTFAELKKKKGSLFPYTKIQMILTKETFPEQENFYKMFSDCVDEVSVSAYMERGGNLEVLTDSEKVALLHNLPTGKKVTEVQFWKDLDGQYFIEAGRLPCEQLYQRMMVSYDGRVFMCCYDWGNEHPIGFLSDQSFKNGDADYKAVMESAAAKKKGFELMTLKMPSRNVKTPQVVSTLAEIWNGKELNNVRDVHIAGEANKVEICRNCTFKETYTWKKLL